MIKGSIGRSAGSLKRLLLYRRLSFDDDGNRDNRFNGVLEGFSSVLTMMDWTLPKPPKYEPSAGAMILSDKTVTAEKFTLVFPGGEYYSFELNDGSGITNAMHPMVYYTD